MRRAVLFIAAALCFVFADKAHAQRALPGMRGLEIRGGMVDGFHSSGSRNELVIRANLLSVPENKA